jgi:hypothetical protein
MDEKRIHCLGCGAKSPEVETEYTLISGRFGWRLSRRLARDGSFILEWRCPNCWAKFKSERAASGDGETPPSSRRPDLLTPPASSRRDPDKR